MKSRYYPWDGFDPQEAPDYYEPETCEYEPCTKEEPAMLVLSRRKNESLVFELPDGRKIEVMVCRISGDRVRIGIEAPEDVVIVRKELEGQS